MKLLRLSQVLECVPWSRATIYRLMPLGKFPSSVMLGDNSAAWRAEDIKAFIDGLKPTYCPSEVVSASTTSGARKSA